MLTSEQPKMAVISRSLRQQMFRGRRFMVALGVMVLIFIVFLDTFLNRAYSLHGTTRSIRMPYSQVDNPPHTSTASKPKPHIHNIQNPTSAIRKVTEKKTQSQTTETFKTTLGSVKNVTEKKTQNQTAATAKATLGTTKNTTTPREILGTTVPEQQDATYEVTKECLPRIDTSDIKTPFKIYVYELPASFSYDIQRSMSTEDRYSHCYDLNYCGTGTELYQFTNGNDSDFTGTNTKSPKTVPKSDQVTRGGSILSIRDTQQFSLETIIHYKMLNSPYRTLDPEKADMFYIPAYTGLNCLKFSGDSKEFVNNLFNYLSTKESSKFYSGKPQILTLSKIQREQGSENCPTIKHPDTHNVTFIGIEKESNPNWAESMYGRSLIVAPYPSYVHFLPHRTHKTLYEFENGNRNLSKTHFYLDVPNLQDRTVLLFLAAGTRRSNHFRAGLLDQFPIQTTDSYEDMLENSQESGKAMPKQVMLITSECAESHRFTTIPWMRKSVYCLQPPGDSPTRKSIYDSILSGCIPVLFSERYKTEYPFEKYLNYSQFTYTIDKKQLVKQRTVFDIVQEIPYSRTQILHQNLRKVAKWFQYSMINTEMNDSDDALTLILDEIAKENNIIS